MYFNQEQKKFIKSLEKEVEKIGKGYSVGVDECHGYIHINGANHLSITLGNNTVEYNAVGGSRFCYTKRETFEECLLELKNKLLTVEEINKIYRSIFNSIKE